MAMNYGDYNPSKQTRGNEKDQKRKKKRKKRYDNKVLQNRLQNGGRY